MKMIFEQKWKKQKNEEQLKVLCIGSLRGRQVAFERDKLSELFAMRG